jgi:DNA ligase-1
MDALTNTTSNNEKIEILKVYVRDKTDKMFIELLLDKTKPFGVKSTNIKKRMKTSPNGEKHDMDLLQLCLGLSNRLFTGHTALDYCIYFIKQHSGHTELLFKIFDKKLNARVSSTTLNKAIGDSGKFVFKVALGENATAKILEKIDPDSFLVSRKLDGVRCITIINSKTDIRFYSRQNKEFFSCENILRDIKFTVPMVLDGEITVDGGKDNFKGVMQMIRKKEPMENVLYNVFDILTPEEFSKHVGTVPLSDRLKRNFKFVGEYIKMVEQFPFSQMKIMKSKAKQNDWEGLIMRKNSWYLGKRSKDILKIKQFHTEEYRVVATENGVVQELVNGKFKDTIALKNAVIETGNGTTTAVGSGFTIEERKLYYAHPEKIIGMIIGVQYFEKSESGKLRFPTFLVNYGRKRNG